MSSSSTTPHYKCDSCGHIYTSSNSFRNHFNHSKSCRRVKPQTSVVSTDAVTARSSPLGSLFFLADRPPSPHSSPAPPGSIDAHECDISIPPTNDFNTMIASNSHDNNLDDTHYSSYSPTPSLPDFSSTINYSYGDTLCGITLPIEQDPDFANVGAHLELGEESNSSASSDDNGDQDDDFAEDQSGAPLFSGFLAHSLADDARVINDSRLQPADEALLSLIIDNHLPQDMYNKILDWAHYSRFSKYDGIPNAIDYRTALKHLHTKYANVCGGSPLSEIVTVPGYQPMHVYRFDFLMQAQRLYHNKDLMNNSLWDYDPKVNDTGERLYSEMNTGDFWKLGVDYVSQRASLSTADHVLPHRFCPVILFIDSTLADRIGRLKVEPVLCSFGNICGDKRRLASSWFILGFIPPYPKSSIEVSADRSKVDSKHEQIEYYHRCLRSILQDLLLADKNEHGHELFVGGYGKIHAHFKLSLVIGDTEGHDKVCTHYCSYSSNLQRVSRDCDLPQSKCDDPDANCNFVVMEDLKGIVKEQIAVLNAIPKRNVGDARAKLQAISQVPVMSAFFDFDYCGDPHGIFGSCPFERLHAWLSGTMKDGMRYLFLLCDLPPMFREWCDDPKRDDSTKPNCAITDSDYHINKAKFEAIFRFLTMCSRRQSDREVPRTPFKNGVTDLTRLNGQEYPGLVMLTLVALKGVLKDRVDESWHEDIASLLWMMLSLNEQMSSSVISSSELESLDDRIKVFLHKYKEVFGYVALANSKVGLKKIKFHAAKHCVFYIKRYGSSENTFGGSLESALKSTVKEPTKRTSRRHDHLCKELASRQHDRFCVFESLCHNKESWEEFLSSTLPAPKRLRRNGDDEYSSADSILPQGWIMHKPVFYLSKSGDEWSTYRGKKTFHNDVVYPNFVSTVDGDVFDTGEAEWVRASVDKADELGFTRVDVFCGAMIPTERVDKSKKKEPTDVFRCHPSFHSYPYLRRSWHDWALIKWKDTTGGDSEYTVAARLLLFAKLSQHKDDTSIPAQVVAVIQSLSKSEPEPDNLLKFAKGDTIDRTPLVVDADTIASTAFVLPCSENMNDDFPLDIEEATYFVVIPPREDWKHIGWDEDNS